MKKIFLLFFLLSGIYPIAICRQNYYVSSSGLDKNDGLTPATAWHSILKVNTSFGTMTAGDSVLFKSGDTFYGTLVPTVSGITFGSYGTHAKPVITGLTTVSSWTSLKKNIWEATVPQGLATLNMVVMKGKLIPMGRYPNADAPNSGYRTFTSFVPNASITDVSLPANPDWTGAELVVRKNPYCTARTIVMKQSDGIINFNLLPGSSFAAQGGYFIQNHPATLDQEGEWFYEASTHTIKMYHTGIPPSIQVSTLANLVTMVFNNNNRKSNIHFNGISFKGSEDVIMKLSFCDNIIIDNCDFSFAGVNAIEHRNINFLKIRHCAISDVNMVGILESNYGSGNNITIQNNTLRRIGINPGMVSGSKTYNESASGNGILIGAKNLIVRNNTIDSVGYIGIALIKNRDNQRISKNIIGNFCSVKNDGGGIYNSGLRGDPVALNVVIDSNIVFRSLNASDGTPYPDNQHARGIYLDASSTGISVLNNLVFDVWEGIYISQAQHITIKNNTIYNAGHYSAPPHPVYAGAISISDVNDGFQHTRNNTITNNTIYTNNPGQLPFYLLDRYNSVDSIGLIDSNHYVNPVTELPFFVNNTMGGAVQTVSLSQWKSGHPLYDLHSKTAAKKLSPFTIKDQSGKNKSPDEFFQEISATQASNRRK